MLPAALRLVGILSGDNCQWFDRAQSALHVTGPGFGIHTIFTAGCCFCRCLFCSQAASVRTSHPLAVTLTQPCGQPSVAPTWPPLWRIGRQRAWGAWTLCWERAAHRCLLGRSSCWPWREHCSTQQRWGGWECLGLWGYVLRQFAVLARRLY